MKHIAYVHTNSASLVEILSRVIRRALPAGLRTPPSQAGPRTWRSRVLVCIGWLIVLVVQAALILVIREVIQLCHGVIDLYLDLAKLQLDLTSQYVAATTPK